MIESLFNAYKLPDLRRRINFVLGMFAVFIFGLHIPVSGINEEAMRRLLGSGLLGLLDVFSGGALRKFSIFAMGITPYINASIIMQLLTIAIPRLEELAKEGETGRKLISQYTRYMTIGLSIFQGTGMSFWLRRTGVLPFSGFSIFRIVITLTAGTAFLMWLGELITDKGIGNGVSLIIFCGIMARIPTEIGRTFVLYGRSIGPGNILLLIIIFLFTVTGIIMIQQGQRKIPVQYAKRIIGRRMYGGQSTYIPLKVNQAGVIPIIFAISVILFPTTIAQFAPKVGYLGSAMGWIVNILSPGHIFYTIVYAILVIGFTFFYTAVTFNLMDVTENLKKYGGFIPGIRPGKPTAEYLDRILTRITLAGAVFLAIIAVMPTHVMSVTKVTTFTLVGGTALLIVVGVVLDTVQQIEAHLIMRHYEGFIK